MALNVWQRTIVDDTGAVIPSAEIEVFEAGTATNPSLFEDAAGATPLTNPFNATAEGFAQFYVAGGTYDIVATGGGSTITWSDYELENVQGYPADRDALVAFNTNIKNLGYLKDKDLGGQFIWRSGDISGEILGSDITSTAVNDATDTITSASHGLATGDAVLAASAANGLSTNTLYYVIRVDADDFQLATSFANALAGASLDLVGTTNFTVNLHKDPAQGKNALPAAALGGGSGVWARAKTFGIPAWEFGMRPNDGTADAVNLRALQAALDYARDHSGGTVLLPEGQIQINGMARLRGSGVCIKGVGAVGSFFNDDGRSNRGSELFYTGSGDDAVLAVGDDVNKFSGIELSGFLIDAAYGTVGVRLERGIINSTLRNLHMFRSTTSCELYGDAVINSFGNRFITCSFEHFTQYGLDMIGDGNETTIFGNKFMNTSGNNPTAALKIGPDDLSAGVWILCNSFGATNVDVMIDVKYGQAIHIDYNTIEASGNSTAGNEADYLVKFGDTTAGTAVTGASCNYNRFVGNSKAGTPIRLEDVDGLDIHGNTVFSSGFTGSNFISRTGCSNVSMRRNELFGGGVTNSFTGFIDYLPDAAGPTYTTSNVTATRTFNADTVTLAELADVVGTMIADAKVRRTYS